MSNHLSKGQFAKCAAGLAAKDELQHIGECPGCSAELERFGNTLSLFRRAVRDRVDDRVASHPVGGTPLRADPSGNSILRWAVVGTAFVVLVTLPFFVGEIRPREAGLQRSAETSPDALMDRVNLHLSRTVPAPMEPIMSLIPNGELVIKSGGVQ